MYAFITLVAAVAEAGIEAIGKGVGQARKQRAIKRATPVTSAADGTPREISGRAVPGPIGTLTAPLSDHECVWYAVTVLERYNAWRPGPLGPTQVIRHTKIAEHFSGPLHVTGEDASVRVDTRGAELDLGEPQFTSFEQQLNSPVMSELTALLGVAPRPRHRPDRTLGLIVQERFVTEGETLRVIGRARTELGDRVIGKPALRPFIVTRPEPAPAA